MVGMSPITPYVPVAGNDGELSDDADTFWGNVQSQSGFHTPGQASLGEAAEVVHQQRLEAAAAAVGAGASPVAGGSPGSAAAGG